MQFAKQCQHLRIPSVMNVFHQFIYEYIKSIVFSQEKAIKLDHPKILEVDV